MDDAYEDVLSIHEDKPKSTSNQPQLSNKVLTAIRKEVAKQVSCVPWKCGEDAYHNLRCHESSVIEYIKLLVPLHDPEFVMTALGCLVDEDTYFEFCPMTCYEWPKLHFRLGRETQWLPEDLCELMEEFVLGIHGNLTGYKENMSDMPQDMNESQWKNKFMKEKLDECMAWVTKHNEAIDNKILVRIKCTTHH